MVGPVPACRTCAPALHARQQQMAGSGVSGGGAAPGGYSVPSSAPQGGGYGAPPPYPAGYAPQASYAPAQQEHGGNLALGLLAGLAIGIVASIIVMKILFYTGFGLSYLYIGVGYGIGFGIHKFTGRGGTGLAAAAVGIMVVSLFIAHVVFGYDELQKAMAHDPSLAGVSALDIIPALPSMFSPMHWVCIAIGMYSCWRAMEQQEG